MVATAEIILETQAQPAVGNTDCQRYATGTDYFYHRGGRGKWRVSFRPANRCAGPCFGRTPLSSASSVVDKSVKSEKSVPQSVDFFAARKDFFCGVSRHIPSKIRAISVIGGSIPLFQHDFLVAAQPRWGCLQFPETNNHGSKIWNLQ